MAKATRASKKSPSSKAKSASAAKPVSAKASEKKSKAEKGPAPTAKSVKKKDSKGKVNAAADAPKGKSKGAAADAVNQAAAQVRSVAKSVVGAVNKALKSAEGVKNEVSRKIALESESAKKAAKGIEKALVDKARKTVESVMPAQAEAAPMAESVGTLELDGMTEQERKALNRKITQAGSNWEAIYKIAKDLKARGYKMSESFNPKTPIVHKVLGWGFVLSSENNRIQVLFKDGLKTLITNYQK